MAPKCHMEATLIHSAPTSAKFKKLVRRLRPFFDSHIVSVDVVVTGILERIWHIGIESAKRGDIGRFDNELIAEMVGWLGDPDELIDILIDIGWLDKSPKYRILIHDWNEHCPGFIKRNIKRQGGFACDSTEPTNDPSPTAQSSSESLSEDLATHESHLESSSEPASSDTTTQGSGLGSTPNITQHNPTQQNKTKPPAASDFVVSDSSSLDFKNDDVFWTSEPIGWIEFDWIACRQAFIARWKELPSGETTGGVRASRYSDLASDLCGPFADRWSSREWREVCRDAFEKIASDGGLKNRNRLSLKKWLTEESTADNVINGAYDFDPNQPRSKSASGFSDTAFDFIKTKAES